MALVVLLDAGPLGLLCVQSGVPLADRCRAWLANLGVSGADVVVSSVVEFEVRRELTRVGATAKLKKLDDLEDQLSILAPSERTWKRAAEFWAIVRRAGKPTADPHALDADCILAAQAALIGLPGDFVVIATTNVGHLNRFPGVVAKTWTDIAP